MNFLIASSHVYLPNEDFDGIDWKKVHQPIHGPLGYDAASKEDIQLLSDPFFAPGVGEPIGKFKYCWKEKPQVIGKLAEVYKLGQQLDELMLLNKFTCISQNNIMNMRIRGRN